MVNAAIVVLAGTESHADTGRLVNGLEAAKEFADNEADELVGEQEATQTATFTASEEMSEYYCQLHPGSMRGGIEIGS